MPGCTLTLSSDNYCNVVTPLYTAAGSVSGSINNNCGTATTNLLVDASQMSAIEGEPAIAINPTDPQNLYVAANHYPEGNPSMVRGAYSTNGGASWSGFTNSALSNSYCDPSVAFDAYGNLFVCYLDVTNSVVVLQSGDKGVSLTNSQVVFHATTNFGLDWTRIATGPVISGTGTVWVTSYDPNSTNSVVSVASVTNSGSVPQWAAPAQVPNTGPDAGASKGYGFGDIAVGPTGQVAVVVQDGGTAPSGTNQLRLSLNPYGVSQYSSFQHDHKQPRLDVRNGYLHGKGEVLMLTCELDSPALGSLSGAERAAVPGSIILGAVFTRRRTPLFLGLQSFNVTCVPEPSSLGIGALRAVSVWFPGSGM